MGVKSCEDHQQPMKEMAFQRWLLDSHWCVSEKSNTSDYTPVPHSPLSGIALELRVSSSPFLLYLSENWDPDTEGSCLKVTAGEGALVQTCI